MTTRPKRLLALAAVTAALVPVTAARAEDGSWNRYWTVGGTSDCVEPGSEADGRYRQAQLAYFGYDTPIPCPNPATIPPPAPETPPCRVFVLAGGNYCHAEGTAQYDLAVELERQYLEYVEEHLNPGTIIYLPPVAPPPPAPSAPVLVSAPPEVVIVPPALAPDVAVPDCPEGETLAEDLTCVGPGYYPAPVPPAATAAVSLLLPETR
jgi:hypothetical protein